MSDEKMREAVRVALNYADGADIPLVAKSHIQGLAKLLESALSQPAAVEGWKSLPIRNIEMVNQPCEFQVLLGFNSCRAASEFKNALFTPTLPQSEDARGAGYTEEDCKLSDETKQIVMAGFDKQFPASGLLSEKVEQPEAVEPVPYLLDGARFKLSFQQDECPHCGEMLDDYVVRPLDQYKEELEGEWVALVPAADDQHLKYTLSPTASQVLRMAADVCDEAIAGLKKAQAPLELIGVAISIKQAIEALIPPTESDQFKAGFAEGVKAAADEAVEQGYISEDGRCYKRMINLTPPTDTVTMTREGKQKTWDWRENARQIITNPEIAVSAFGYEWLSDVARTALNDAWHLRTEFESTALDIALATEQLTFDKRMRSGNIADRVDIDECRAIVAQHMPKESK